MSLLRWSSLNCTPSGRSYNAPLSLPELNRSDPSTPQAPLETADDASSALDDLEQPTTLNGAPLRRAMAFVTLSWIFGAVWMNALAGAPLTLYATTLGASNFQFGLLAALPFLAQLISLPASVVIDRTGERKKIFFIGLYANRLLWIPIAVIPALIVWRGADTAVAMGVFLALTFLMHAGQAIGGPAWVNWMADIVPGRVRGRYFARRRQWGILSAIPAALITGWVLDHYRGVTDTVSIMIICAVIFCVAAVFGVADIAIFHLVPHKVKPRPRAPLLATLFHPLKDRRFMWFSVSAAILWFAVAGQGQFVNKYLIEHLHVTSTKVQLIVLVCPLLCQLLVLPVWGRAIDRFGKKPAMIISILGLVPVGAGWCLMNSGHVVLGYVLAMAGAACWTGVELANSNLVFEFSAADKTGKGGGTAYVAINSVIINIAGCMGGLFYGVIAETLADFRYETGITWLAPLSFYEVLFAISAVLRLAAVFPLLHVQEPAAGPTFVALRFMAGNLYNNVAGAVLLPARLIRRDNGDEAESNAEA
ncbi:MAG TPA: MFS transporter [Tepidisphaeraceae bacterium]|jgi:MFS family permease